MTCRTRVQGLMLIIIMLIAPAVWAEVHYEYKNGATCTLLQPAEDPLKDYRFYPPPSLLAESSLMLSGRDVAFCHVTMTSIWTPGNFLGVWVDVEGFKNMYYEAEEGGGERNSILVALCMYELRIVHCDQFVALRAGRHLVGLVSRKYLHQDEPYDGVYDGVYIVIQREPDSYTRTYIHRFGATWER